jgi:hypothetical protein
MPQTSTIIYTLNDLEQKSEAVDTNRVFEEELAEFRDVFDFLKKHEIDVRPEVLKKVLEYVKTLHTVE